MADIHDYLDASRTTDAALLELRELTRERAAELTALELVVWRSTEAIVAAIREHETRLAYESTNFR